MNLEQAKLKSAEFGREVRRHEKANDIATTVRLCEEWMVLRDEFVSAHAKAEITEAYTKGYNSGQPEEPQTLLEEQQ